METRVSVSGVFVDGFASRRLYGNARQTNSALFPRSPDASRRWNVEVTWNGDKRKRASGIMLHDREQLGVVERAVKRQEERRTEWETSSSGTAKVVIVNKAT